MVSIEGYKIGEYVIFTVVSYGIVGLSFLIRMMVDHLKGREKWKSVGLMLVSLGGMYYFYKLPFRIGVIFGVIGFFSAFTIYNIVEMFNSWNMGIDKKYDINEKVQPKNLNAEYASKKPWEKHPKYRRNNNG